MDLHSQEFSKTLAGVRFYEFTKPAYGNRHFEVIIIGGSYAGIAAAFPLGQAGRHVMIIDSSNSSNKNAQHTYNFLGYNGESHAAIIRKAKKEVLHHKTVHYLYDIVLSVKKQENRFHVETRFNGSYSAKKILMASGVTYRMIDLEGFRECWGISVFQNIFDCNSQFGNKAIGILGNREEIYRFAALLKGRVNKLIVFTNGKPVLPGLQINELAQKNITVIEKKIQRIEHDKGQMKTLVFRDKTSCPLNLLFTQLPIRQAADIAQRQLKCEVTPGGLLKVDECQQTSVPGLYAAGDNCTQTRSMIVAASTGVIAGISLVNLLASENFK